MTAARFLVADVFDGLAALKAEGTQVDLVMTSPPFLALRSYLPPDHPDKAKEIGSEPTPADFLSTMLAVTEACADVLAPHGSICFELGDTYSGSGGAGGDYAEGGLREGQEAFDGSARRTRPVKASPDKQSHRDMGEGVVAITGGRGWPLPKSLTFMPQLFGASLAYGRNLLDPERTTDPWRVRNFVAWVRPNPPVGALGDKVRPATSYLTWACKSDKRWFDLDAVRTANARADRPSEVNGTVANRRDEIRREVGLNTDTTPWSGQNPAGAPPLDWWKISPGGYKGAHYATMPAELCRIPIEASCPRRVCRECGTPSRRETQPSEEYADARASKREAGKVNAEIRPQLNGATFSADHLTTGWTSCGCPGTDGIRLDGYHTGPGWRPGIVLDPFGGSGTSALAATGRGRDAILIDLDSRNADLALERLGMFLTVEHLTDEAVA